MGRGRGKGKKQPVIERESDPGSGEEEKLLAFRRRGRPLKPLMDDIEEVEVTEKIEKDEENVNVNGNGNGSSKDLKTQVIAVNKRKRKRSSQAKGKEDPAKEESGVRAKPGPDDPVKPAGFRQNGSRRKNKPRRAAEAGVDCK